jgi:hypothetical protein
LRRAKATFKFDRFSSREEVRENEILSLLWSHTGRAVARRWKGFPEGMRLGEDFRGDYPEDGEYPLPWLPGPVFPMIIWVGRIDLMNKGLRLPLDGLGSRWWFHLVENLLMEEEDIDILPIFSREGLSRNKMNRIFKGELKALI